MVYMGDGRKHKRCGHKMVCAVMIWCCAAKRWGCLGNAAVGICCPCSRDEARWGHRELSLRRVLSWFARSMSRSGSAQWAAAAEPQRLRSLEPRPQKRRKAAVKAAREARLLKARLLPHTLSSVEIVQPSKPPWFRQRLTSINSFKLFYKGS